MNAKMMEGFTFRLVGGMFTLEFALHKGENSPHNVQFLLREASLSFSFSLRAPLFATLPLQYHSLQYHYHYNQHYHYNTIHYNHQFTQTIARLGKQLHASARQIISAAWLGMARRRFLEF